MKQHKTSIHKKTLSLPDLIAEDIKVVAGKLKLEPWEIGWWQYHKAGGRYNSFIPNIGGWNSVKNTYYPKPVNPASVITLSDIRSKQNFIARNIGHLDNLVKDFSNAIKETPVFDPKDVKYIFNGNNRDINRVVNLVLSDLHFGSDLVSTATNKAFGCIEESRAFAQVIKTTCEYKRDHRNKTELHVWLIGDVIEGNIHPSGAALITDQFKRAVWLLSQGFAVLLKEFSRIHVHCVSGNHGRNPSVHFDRAIDNKANSYETMIYFALAHKFSDVDRITFDIPNSPEVTATVLGFRFYGTHGDTLLKPGNIGGTIKTGMIESEINAIDRNEVADGRKPFDIYIIGHVHKGTVLALDFGGTLIINSGLPPANNYAKSVRIHRAQQAQVLFESTAELAFGDYRRIYCGNTEDNKDLDKIIKPWSE